MRKFIRQILHPDLIRSTWRRVIHLWKPMAAWILLIWAIIAVILAPVSSAVLGLQFFRSGELVIGNEELLSWLVSPVGFGYMLLGATLALTGWVLQFAGLFQIATEDIYGRTVNFHNITLRIISKTYLLFRLCLFIVAAGLFLLLPLVLGWGLVYELFLDTYDINYYLSETPIEWRLALISSIAWLFIWLSWVAYIIARCLFALPAYLHSEKSIKESIIYAWKTGHEKTTKNLKSLFPVISFWVFIRFIADVILLSISIWIISWVNNNIGSLRIIALTTGLYLIVSLIVDAIIYFLGFSYVSTLITKLYFRDFHDLTRTPAPPARHKFKKLTSFFKDMLQPKWLSVTIGTIFIISFFISGYMLEQIPQPNPDKAIKIAAHRAGPPPAPENSLSALDLSIQAGAEIAEIDIQLTHDSVIVVAHDLDLMRLTGNPARIIDNSYESLQKIVGDQHPLHTLDEFLAASRDKIELMIELKKPDQSLIRSMISTIQQFKMENEVTIISMNPDAVSHVNNIAPEITVGYISAISLGNMNRLPVDLLAINYRSITNRMIEDAHQQNLEVYAWTVNSADIMTTMIERNVDGIITDNPELGIEVRNAMQELTTAERLLLQFNQVAR